MPPPDRLGSGELEDTETTPNSQFPTPEQLVIPPPDRLGSWELEVGNCDWSRAPAGSIGREKIGPIDQIAN
jgi:hypothetical protein